MTISFIAINGIWPSLDGWDLPFARILPVYLSEGRDRYIGTDDADLVFGLDGNDRLNGKDGDGILNGGSGNDQLNGGNGNDTASYDGANSGVTVSLATTRGQNTGGAGSDRLRSIENLSGSEYSDDLTGNSLSNILSGGAGDDTLFGGQNADTLCLKPVTGTIRSLIFPTMAFPPLRISVISALNAVIPLFSWMQTTASQSASGYQ